MCCHLIYRKCIKVYNIDTSIVTLEQDRSNQLNQELIDILIETTRLNQFLSGVFKIMMASIELIHKILIYIFKDY